MSTIDEKLERAERTLGGKARCWLKKHLTYRDGSPSYVVVAKDESGPLVVTVKKMDKTTRWVRVQKQDGDFLMELEETV